MNRAPAAIEQSRDLALQLQTTLRRTSVPNVLEVRSRNPKTPNTWYAVTRGIDGTLICSCPASFNRLGCWHQTEVRKVFDMTTETRALVPVVVQPSVALLPSEHELDVVQRTAAMVFAGAVTLPSELNTKEKVAAVMLYGLELGLKPMTALRHLYIVKGRVSPSAELMAGICMTRERDIAFHIEEISAEVCTIRMIRPSRGVNAVYTVTWAQIQRAGLAKDANALYPEDRLRYHCMKRLMRAYAQDLINGLDEGVYVPGLTQDAETFERGQPIDMDELYNEGDAPEPGTAADNPLQDFEDADVIEQVPTATDEQLAAIADWSDQLKERDDGKAKLSSVDTARRERWSYAVEEGSNRFTAKRLTVTDADAYIALLRETHEGAPAEPVAAGLPI